MLIKCPECGREVSDKAKACIHCGFPFDSELQNSSDSTVKQSCYDIFINNEEAIKVFTHQKEYLNEKINSAKSYLTNEQFLLQEILGYDKNESKKIASQNIQLIAQNVNNEQVCKIVAPLCAYKINVSICMHDTKELIDKNDIDGYSAELEVAKSYYYDEPVVDTKNLVMVSEGNEGIINPLSLQEPVFSNSAKCPTCGSSNVKYLTVLERAVSINFLGAASNKINKTFKCGECGFTW